MSFLIASKPFKLTEEEYKTYLNYSEECPFLSKILKGDSNNIYHISKFGQSLHSFFKQKKEFLFLESLNIVYILGSIFKFMNTKVTQKGVPSPKLSMKKIYYFGGMINTSVYLRKTKNIIEEEEKKIKDNENDNLLEIESKQLFFLSSLLYQLLTKKKPNVVEGSLEIDESQKKLKKNYASLLSLIENGLTQKFSVEKGLAVFIDAIKTQAKNYEEINLRYQKEDHSKLEDFSLEIHQFTRKMTCKEKETLFIRDSLYLGYLCVLVRRLIVYYILYNDISINDKTVYRSLVRIAIQNEKFETFYQIYFDIANENKKYEEFLKILRIDNKRKDMIQEIKKKYPMADSQNKSVLDFFNKFQDFDNFLLNKKSI